MKSKSFYKESYLHDQTQRYGEIIAESYYTTTRAGVYKESSPNTSDILNQWFWPVVNCFELRDNYFFIGEWNTGIFFESYKQPDGVTVERLIFKPTLESCNTDLCVQELNTMFNKLYRNAGNDSGRTNEESESIKNIY